MKVELIKITENPEKHIESCGRTCYKSTDKMTDKTTANFIKKIIKNGHESVLEHSSATFRVSGVSRALTHQLVRHRIGFSFSQQSQRFANQKNGFEIEFVTPHSIKNADNEFRHIYLSAMNHADEAYYMLIESGIPKEDARFVLPNACCTEIVVTMNFRAARNFLKLRLDEHAQWEIREMAHLILDFLYKHAPNVFEDLDFRFK